MRTDNPHAKDIAQQELRDMLASTEALLAALGDQSGDAIDDLRARLTSTISDVKRELSNSFVMGAALALVCWRGFCCETEGRCDLRSAAAMAASARYLAGPTAH
jgi:DUF883 N-terminal domain